MELRQKMIKEFPWMRFSKPRGFPVGPHPLPMWVATFGAYENRNKWAAVREFVLANNPKNLSILIHPIRKTGWLPTTPDTPFGPESPSSFASAFLIFFHKRVHSEVQTQKKRC
mmetsp:Transcript_20653/g.42511  ORF Transcript_20653/g.42511 Transcript_20653/m.42511 type:complete len:113 (+) Transcript_20653:241-579(+)